MLRKIIFRALLPITWFALSLIGSISPIFISANFKSVRNAKSGSGNIVFVNLEIFIMYSFKESLQKCFINRIQGFHERKTRPQFWGLLTRKKSLIGFGWIFISVDKILSIIGDASELVNNLKMFRLFYGCFVLEESIAFPIIAKCFGENVNSISHFNFKVNQLLRITKRLQ